MKFNIPEKYSYKKIIDVSNIDGSLGNSSASGCLKIYTCPSNVEAIVEVQMVSSNGNGNVDLRLYDLLLNTSGYVSDGNWTGVYSYGNMSGPLKYDTNTTSSVPMGLDEHGIPAFGKAENNSKYVGKRFRMFPGQFLGYHSSSSQDGRVRIAIIKEEVTA